MSRMLQKVHDIQGYNRLSMIVPEVRRQPAIRAARTAAFTRFAWGVLAYNVFVVLWGALVRATGSGAGCGNHWPLCNGEVAPPSPTLSTLIELTHRATTGVDVFLVGALMVWAFRAYPKNSPVR